MWTDRTRVVIESSSPAILEVMEMAGWAGQTRSVLRRCAMTAWSARNRSAMTTHRETERRFLRDARTLRGQVFAAFVVVLPGTLLAAVLLADFFTPEPHYRFLSPLITAVPALAAATSGKRGAVVFTALSVGASFLLANLDDRLYTPGFYGQLAGLAVIFAVSLLPGHQRARREQKLAQARSVAETVQRAVVAPIPEQIGCIRTSAAYVAAEEEARIGGDLYEALQTPYGIRMIMGDVRGKGLPAVGAAANLLGAFREAAPHAADLSILAERLEGSVKRHNARAGLEASDFITATVLSVPSGPVAEMVCCGHPGPILIRGGEVTDVQATRPSPPLGLGELSTSGYHVDTLSFDLMDCLLLYTDGVTEARNHDGVFYPLANRVTAWANAEPEHLIDQLVYDLADYTGGRLNDDAAMLASQRLASFPDTV